MSRARTLAFYSVAVAISISLLSSAGMAGVAALEQKIIESQTRDLRALAVATGEKFSSISTLMTLTSRLPQLADTPHSGEITAEFHGVPEGVEIEKRQVAKYILSQNRDIEAVAFILPDGEMYVEGPFARQMNLTRTNFAFRNYF